jgi:branched-chain amino acid transport system substrate-binding protein
MSELVAEKAGGVMGNFWLRIGVSILAVVLLGLGAPQRALAGYKGEIRVGGIFDLTGAFGIEGKQYAEGVLDYVRYINEAKGGIKHQKWTVLVADAQYELHQAVEAYRKFTAQDQVVAFLGWGAADVEAMAPMFSKDEIPYLSASYSVQLANASKFPYIFIGATSYSTQARAACQFVKMDWKRWAERPPRISFMYTNDGFGRSPIPAGKAEAATLGITLAGDHIINLLAVDTADQLREMEKEGTDYLIIQSNMMTSAMVAKDLRALKLSTKMICLNSAIDEMWLDLVKEAGDGVYGCIPYALWSDENFPSVRLMRQVSNKYHRNIEERTCHYVQGFVAAMLLEAALKRAPTKPTGKQIKEAFETFRNVDTGGLLPPVTYTPASHEPCNSLRIYQVKRGKLVPVTNYITVSR